MTNDELKSLMARAVTDEDVAAIYDRINDERIVLLRLLFIEHGARLHRHLAKEIRLGRRSEVTTLDPVVIADEEE